MAKNIGVIKLPVNRLHMELTNICNFSCEFCPDAKMKRQRGMMSFEMAKGILDEVSNSGMIKTVLFHVMGEPTLYPRLIDVTEYASAKSVDTCLTTNGSHLDEKLVDELIRAGVGKIIVSLQTPDERTFALRGAKGIYFEDYAEKIVAVIKKFLSGTEKTKLIISFLSSPLRRLIIPIFPEVSIADTSSDLKRYLRLWAKRILMNTPLEDRYNGVLKQIQKIRTFKENTIFINDRVTFHTRILGDWSIHFDRENINAHFGYCPAIQDNFGILWNGDYTFCCTDYNGMTSTHDYKNTPINDYLWEEVIQETVRGFNKFRVLHPYCKQCLGERNVLNAIVKQIGSVIYFKWLKRNNHII